MSQQSLQEELSMRMAQFNHMARSYKIITNKNGLINNSSLAAHIKQNPIIIEISYRSNTDDHLQQLHFMLKEVNTYPELVEFIFKNGGVVIADFSNNWCMPCKLIAPYIDTFRTQFEIAVARVDTDKSEELSSKFDIHAIPSFLLLKKASGEVTAVEIVVSASVEKLKKMFENASNLKNNKN